MKRLIDRFLLFFFIIVLNLFAFPAFAQDVPSDLSGALSPPNVLSPIPAEYADENRVWQGIPSLEVASDGALWVCWYSGNGENTGNYVLVARSVDGGASWSRPFLCVDNPGDVRVYDANLWRSPDGKLRLFWAQSEESNNDGRLGVWTISTENAEAGPDAVWSAPRRLANGIMLSKPTVDSTGRWLYPISHKPNGRKYKIDPRLLGAAVYESFDDGATVVRLGIAEVPENQRGCDEHRVVENADGSFRIWSRIVDGIGESTSVDGGLTWTPVRPAPSFKNASSRFFVCRLKSGALLLVKNGPIDADVERSRLTAFLSDDDGATWRGGLVLDERDDVSYPDGAQADDGTIYVVYDRERGDAREILVARFAEADVAAGKIVSQNGKLKILANKATGAK